MPAVGCHEQYLESYFQFVIDRWETISDTGGAGLRRGGNGVDMAYRFLEDGTIAILNDRWLTYPWGVKDCEPGARGTQVVLPLEVHIVAIGKVGKGTRTLCCILAVSGNRSIAFTVAKFHGVG